MAHSSSGLGHIPLKDEIRGSNPLCATPTAPVETGPCCCHALREGPPMMPPHTVRFTLDGTWTPAAVAADGPYRYLPFAVPADTARLDVAYTAAPLAAGDPAPGIDIGLFD